jgi:Mn2+/Fe2+ NRAMP family transporter
MLKTIQEKLGPGLLYAAAAVGVSHLVSSTTAGATYGMIMVLYAIVVCLVKYPTFLFGATYAAATGETLVDGYGRLGKWVVVLFFFMQLFEYTFAISGVSVTTGAIVRDVFNLDIPGIGLEVGLIITCMIILAVGRYSVLEDITKVLVIAFSIGTVFAAVIAVGGIATGGADLSADMTLDTPTILLLIAVAGWLPTGTAGSVGLSLWVKAKMIRLGRPVSSQEATFDFHVGYGTAVFTAVCFVILGTLVMYINGVKPAANGAEFSSQLINLFTSTIGHWIYPVIAVSAITVMYSTLLTLVDLLPRSSAAALVRIVPNQFEGKFSSIYLTFIGIELLLVVGVLASLMDQFSTFIALVTSMGFIVAPAFALLNHIVMFGPDVPQADRPTHFIKMWSYGTIAILSLVTVAFVYLTYLS